MSITRSRRDGVSRAAPPGGGLWRPGWEATGSLPCRYRLVRRRRWRGAPGAGGPAHSWRPALQERPPAALERPAKQGGRELSPAPVVSTAATVSPGASTEALGAARTQPAAPRVTAARETPSPRTRSAYSRGEPGPKRNSPSSSLTFTTSATLMLAFDEDFGNLIVLEDRDPCFVGARGDDHLLGHARSSSQTESRRAGRRSAGRTSRHVSNIHSIASINMVRVGAGLQTRPP